MTPETLRVRVTVQRRASEAERSDAKRSEECTRKMHRETDVRRQCWGIPNNTCFAFIRLIRSTSIVAEATGGTPRRKEFRGVRRTKAKRRGNPWGIPTNPRNFRRRPRGRRRGNPWGIPMPRQLPEKTRRVLQRRQRAKRSPTTPSAQQTPRTGPEVRSKGAPRSPTALDLPVRVGFG